MRVEVFSLGRFQLNWQPTKYSGATQRVNVVNPNQDVDVEVSPAVRNANAPAGHGVAQG